MQNVYILIQHCKNIFPKYLLYQKIAYFSLFVSDFVHYISLEYETKKFITNDSVLSEVKYLLSHTILFYLITSFKSTFPQNLHFYRFRRFALMMLGLLHLPKATCIIETSFEVTV